MGTRSTTTFIDINGRKIARIYCQYDGYPDGFPLELKNFIRNGRLGNGISGNPKLGEFFNGFECLVASVIAKFKDEPGTIYMEDPNSENDQEYNYIISETDLGISFFCKETDDDDKDPYNEIVSI